MTKFAIGIVLMVAIIAPAWMAIASQPLGSTWQFGPLSTYRWCEGARISIDLWRGVSISLLFNVEGFWSGKSCEPVA